MLTAKKREFIEFMLNAGVLKFGEFVTKSGRNTQYFVNTGNYRTGEHLAKLGEYYAALIKDVTGGDFDCMFGPAYKGIPLVATASISLYNKHKIDKPFFFNRKEEKDHGEGGSIIGYKPIAGDKVVIVEDVITAGTAIREVMPILKSIGDITVKDMFISVDRCEVGVGSSKSASMEIYEEFGIKVHSIINVTDVREYLASTEEYKDLAKQMDGYMQSYCVGI